MPSSSTNTGTSAHPIADVRAHVLDLCRRGSCVREMPRLVQTLADDRLRAELVAVAAQMRVLGLVLQRLDRAEVLEALPGEAARDLRERTRRARLASAGYQLERDHVVARLRREGIEPLLLKGAALRGTLYADPLQRAVSDIDVLVEEAALETALSALVRAGYRPPPAAEAAAYRRAHFHFRLTHPRGHVMELHWALTTPTATFRLEPARFLADSVFVERAIGPALRVPRSEHMLLHLVAQSAEERFSRFDRIVDVDRIVDAGGLDWAFLCGAARRAGLTNALSLSLELAGALLGTEVPEPVTVAVRPSALVRANLRLLRPGRRVLAPGRCRRSASDQLMHLWLLPGVASRAAALARILARGAIEPTEWAPAPEGPPPAHRRILSLVKTLAFQGALYAGADRDAEGGDPDPVALWPARPDGHSASTVLALQETV
jgi:hypothetical protein